MSYLAADISSHEAVKSCHFSVGGRTTHHRLTLGCRLWSMKLTCVVDDVVDDIVALASRCSPVREGRMEGSDVIPRSFYGRSFQDRILRIRASFHNITTTTSSMIKWKTTACLSPAASSVWSSMTTHPYQLLEGVMPGTGRSAHQQCICRILRPAEADKVSMLH